jgi:hypothetical protein
MKKVAEALSAHKVKIKAFAKSKNLLKFQNSSDERLLLTVERHERESYWC